MGRSRLLAAVVGCGILLLASLVDADVGDYLGRPVVSIRLEAEGRRATDRRLLQVVETPVGRPLSMKAVRETITHLFSLGQFEDVRVHADPAPGGVALLYELMPIHEIARVAFSGSLTAPGVDQGRLRRALEERYGLPMPVGRAPEIARLVEGELRARGYFGARVTPRIELEHQPDRAILRLDIEAGVRTRIGTVDVVGLPAATAAQLLDRLRLDRGDPYERELLNARVEEVIVGYRRRAYYEARLLVATRLVDNDRVVNLTLTLTLGPRVRVIFSGDPLPDSRPEDLVPIAREGSTDEDLLEDATNRIEEALRAQGYREATAPHTREESGGELRLTFNVRRGPRYRIDQVAISGNASVPLAELEPNLRLRRGQPFAEAALEADLAAIEQLYQRRGFAAAAAQSSLDPLPNGAAATEILAAVSISIAENARTVVGSVRIEDDAASAEPPGLEVLGLQAGRPFFLTQMVMDRDTIQRHYVDRGYLNASVTSNPGLSADDTRADVLFSVRAGVLIRVEHVLIVGNTRTRAEIIERELQMGPGDPIGLAAVNESQRRLAALGLFRRTRISEVGHGDETLRDLLVSVEEAPPTTIGYGGGLELAQRIRRREADSSLASTKLEVAPRAFFEISRRNLFGKNRSVNLFTRISVRPKDSPFFANSETAAAGDRSGFGFSEYRVLATFREPRVLGTVADAFLTGTAEQQIRSSFNFSRRAFSAGVGRPLSRYVSLSGSYQIQRTDLFDESINESEKLLIDRLFPQVRLSSFSVSVVRDTRDDPFGPSAGHYVGANGQFAARWLGSEVGLVKSYLTAQAFRTLPRTNRVIFAASARLGLATAFARPVPRTDSSGEPILGLDGQPLEIVVREVPASERFFAGGGTTVRGFVLDQLGTPETIDQDGFPIGGNALSIFNAELRVRLRGGLGVVGFLDAGNVFARATDIDLGRLRSAVGFGVRYQSPVGPIRVDLGFKTRRREAALEAPEKIAVWHISLGQAF